MNLEIALGVNFQKTSGRSNHGDSLINSNDKIDPRKINIAQIDNVIGLIYAASHGDVDEIKK